MAPLAYLVGTPYRQLVLSTDDTPSPTNELRPKSSKRTGNSSVGRALSPTHPGAALPGPEDADLRRTIGSSDFFFSQVFLACPR